MKLTKISVLAVQYIGQYRQFISINLQPYQAFHIVMRVFSDADAVNFIFIPDITSAVILGGTHFCHCNSSSILVSVKVGLVRPGDPKALSVSSTIVLKQNTRAPWLCPLPIAMRTKLLQSNVVYSEHCQNTSPVFYTMLYTLYTFFKD